MGIFDFFKSKKKDTAQNESQPKKITKKELDDLVLTALNVLCDDISTPEDAKELILSKGYTEHQTEIIVKTANDLYQKHFKNKKK